MAIKVQINAHQKGRLKKILILNPILEPVLRPVVTPPLIEHVLAVAFAEIAFLAERTWEIISQTFVL